jgi:uncharacterized membrane protein YjjB (DUF3815 family)
MRNERSIKVLHTVLTTAVTDSSLANDELAENFNCMLLVAETLHANGQETKETIGSVARMSKVFQYESYLSIGWEEIYLQVSDGKTTLNRFIAVQPSKINMNQVAATMKLVAVFESNSKTSKDLKNELLLIDKLPSANNYIFIAACVAGAVALSIIFGAKNPYAILLIGISAGLGAYIRGILSKVNVNPLLQTFAAALLAGIVGAIAVKLNVSTEARLVAVCPCMILVPGPHLLNGTLDLGELRIPLGAARLLFAMLTIFTICAGLLIGLGICSESLPPNAASLSIPIWVDMFAAGIAAISYGIFFSMPFKMLVFPLFAGMAAHVLRWEVMSVYHINIVMAACLACVVAGIITAPISKKYNLPFAGIGFASVVSLIPGVFLFRMSSALIQIEENNTSSIVSLMGITLSDGMVALLIIAAMAFGFVVARRVIGIFNNII